MPALSAALTIAAGGGVLLRAAALIVPSLSMAVFLIFLGTGPVNAATLNAVPADLRATAMAGQLFAIHVLGDMPSSKVIGMISDRVESAVGNGGDAGGVCGGRGDLLCGREVCTAADGQCRGSGSGMIGPAWARGGRVWRYGC